jgi:hypothetical protein
VGVLFCRPYGPPTTNLTHSATFTFPARRA